VTTNSTSSGPSKISTFVLAAIYITLILSIVAVIVAVTAFYQGEPPETTLSMLVIGAIAMALAVYILFQSRKRVASLKRASLPTLTTVECTKCGIKTVREFQRGDYVYKELDKCTKCEDKQVITAIYREIKEKEKPVTV
jgi:hypothetical protein